MLCLLVFTFVLLPILSSFTCSLSLLPCFTSVHGVAFGSMSCACVLAFTSFAAFVLMFNCCISSNSDFLSCSMNIDPAMHSVR